MAAVALAIKARSIFLLLFLSFAAIYIHSTISCCVCVGVIEEVQLWKWLRASTHRVAIKADTFISASEGEDKQKAKLCKTVQKCERRKNQVTLIIWWSAHCKQMPKCSHFFLLRLVIDDQKWWWKWPIDIMRQTLSVTRLKWSSERQKQSNKQVKVHVKSCLVSV